MSGLRELNAMGHALASGEPRQESLLALLQFLNNAIGSLGTTLEVAARAENDDDSGTPNNREAAEIIKNLLLQSVDTVKSTLGTSWIRDKEQGQGQAAYESKSEPIPDQSATALEELAEIFAILTTCAKVCPSFLVSLPAALSVDHDYDRLFDRAVESAVTTLTETDADSTRAATVFLRELVSERVRHG